MRIAVCDKLSASPLQIDHHWEEDPPGRTDPSHTSQKLAHLTYFHDKALHLSSPRARLARIPSLLMSAKQPFPTCVTFNKSKQLGIRSSLNPTCRARPLPRLSVCRLWRLRCRRSSLRTPTLLLQRPEPPFFAPIPFSVPNPHWYKIQVR